MAIIEAKKEEVKTGPLNGLNFVVTGKLSIKRDDFEKMIIDFGGKLQSSVNKKTNFLITDDPNTNTTKNEKANELGIEKISEDEFYNKFNIGTVIGK
ncbi:MAG: BRCT domain-containing protein [Elusimicrobiota bacterium]|jgi:DNA ligase (NAD+)|nr:BRCT domain-containing protein [Elusimicrobiota bacterium]